MSVKHKADAGFSVSADPSDNSEVNPE